MTKLKAPFPYFGGKANVAKLVWKRLGDPDNYCEPFAGTAAVLLRRPNVGKIETINDRNHFVANFWRSVQSDPDLVAEYADHPVSEADLHARHEYLMRGEACEKFRRQFVVDPKYFDPEIAGWWVWGQCCWIGAGWCDDKGMKVDGSSQKRKANVGDGNGIHVLGKQLPHISGDYGAFGRGVVSSAGHNRTTIQKKPALNNWNGAGTGVHTDRPQGRPQLGDAYDIGRGVNSNRHLGLCHERRQWLVDWMCGLRDRLRLVRVCYGDWNRICDSPTTMTRLGLTGVFLDPPYAKNVKRVTAMIRGEEVPKPRATNRSNDLYAGDKTQDIDRLVADVNLWCQKWGSEPNARIALCGYEGEHDNLVADHGWDVVAWTTNGGYGNRRDENTNKGRERIWFSPACLNPQEMLF